MDIDAEAKLGFTKYNLSNKRELSDYENTQLAKIEKEGFQRALHKKCRFLVETKVSAPDTANMLLKFVCQTKELTFKK